MELDTLYYRLKSLTVFRSLLDKPVVGTAIELLHDAAEGRGEFALQRWAALIAQLHDAGVGTLGDWLWDALRYTENPWGGCIEAGDYNFDLEQAARRDVEALSALAELDGKALLDGLGLPDDLTAGLPLWAPAKPISFRDLTDHYRENGCGLFARFRAFLWAGRKLQGIPQPDSPAAEELIGYRRERAQVEANTRALLAGHKVNNALLFGDSGTGKSATVKSLLSLPGAKELRLIEVEKSGVATMPELMRTLAGRRQKFILFLDDLSFDKDDLNYSVLKTILEGGLEPRSDNVAIYATSNRRNLVRQTISDRAGDEMDLNETIQEKTALADRFGLRVIYQSMTMPEFLALVDALARRAGVTLSPEELHTMARTWDIRHPGRSPRSAHQFIASLNI